MSRRRILIVEDDEPTRERLARAIAAHPEEIELADAVGTCGDALRVLRRDPPEVLLVDLDLPDGHGIDLIRAARALSADTQSMVVTVFGDEKSVLGAIEAGARGYLLKDESEEGVGVAILQLLAGGSPITPAIAQHLILRFQERAATTSAESTPVLSKRELEVLELVVKGFTFPEIATLLALSPHTVGTFVRRIYRKLEVRSRAEAVFEALQLGIVKLDG
ncbi:MAG TPA: response regulator transcription factor [Myxococcota bacterium]|nr:response regulator transcription factor [Myxococcota bacterium]